MRSRVWPALLALLVLGAAGPSAAGAVSFGAAVLTPVTGAPFPVANLVAVAPVRGSSALTLTRAPDAASARLARAHADGVHYRSIRLAWSPAGGGVQSLCLDDVAIASYARPPGGQRAIEHETLFFAGATRATGLGACGLRPPPRPVVVRLYTDTAGGLHARVDCLVARCAGSVRILCPAPGACPLAGGGGGGGSFALGPGREALVRLGLARAVRGRHPALIAAVKLTGPARAFQARVVVDPPPPGGLPTLVTSTPSPSTSPAPSGGGTASGGGGATPGTSGSGAAGTGGSGPDTGPVVGSTGGGGTGTGAGGSGGGGTGGGGAGGGGGGGSQVETTLSVICDGPSGSLTGVHGTLAPSQVGAPIEIDYVPVDPNAPTVIHHVATGSGGRYRDTVRGGPFDRVVAIYDGDDTHVASAGTCPP